MRAVVASVGVALGDVGCSHDSEKPGPIVDVAHVPSPRAAFNPNDHADHLDSGSAKGHTSNFILFLQWVAHKKLGIGVARVGWAWDRRRRYLVSSA